MSGIEPPVESGRGTADDPRTRPERSISRMADYALLPGVSKPASARVNDARHATAARMSGHNALTVRYGKAFALGGAGKSRVERHDG